MDWHFNCYFKINQLSVCIDRIPQGSRGLFCAKILVISTSYYITSYIFYIPISRYICLFCMLSSKRFNYVCLQYLTIFIYNQRDINSIFVTSAPS